jgi:hypothetical protein
MIANEDHSDPLLLQDFLLGRLTDADADRVAAHLADIPYLQALADGPCAADPLVEALRDSARGAPPPDALPLLPELLDRLERLSQVSIPTPNCDPQGDTVSLIGPATEAEALAILRPPQAPGELGRLASFRVLGVLGRGGMGLVLRAEDVQLCRQVALKIIRPERAADPSHRDRFLREARAAAALHHDHVMPIHQVGEDNGVLFLAMPLLAGQTLEDRLRRGRLPLAEVVRIGWETAEGLAAAHAAGVIHRDIKPANIWLDATSGGRVRLLDFGLARLAQAADEQNLTQSGAIAGTPGYLSPEQGRGEKVDGRADLFSLGVVLYRLCTGELPFRGPDTMSTLTAIALHDPSPPHVVNPTVPSALSDLVMRLLAKDPARRPASAREAADARAALGSGGESTVAFPAIPRTAPRHWVVTAIAGGLGLFLAGAAAVIAWQVLPPSVPLANAVPTTTGVGLPVAGSTKSDPIDLGKAVPVPADGYIDVLAWTRADGTLRQTRLTEEGSLPLKNGDQYRVEAAVRVPAYLYLFLIDTEGEANPLYPWVPGKWGTRPANEEKQTRLDLPVRSDKGYTINGRGSGMWTLLLLARETAWEATDDEVKQLFAALPPQRPVQHPRSAVWFENGQVVKNDDARRAVSFEETEVNDPVLRMQALLRGKLQPHASLTTAVSFAKVGN